MGLRSVVFTQLCLKVQPPESKTASAKTEFYIFPTPSHSAPSLLKFLLEFRAEVLELLTYIFAADSLVFM